MTTSKENASARPSTVAFVQSFDAILFVRTVVMTEAEESQLRSALLALQSIGCILSPSVDPAVADLSFRDVIEHLRAAIGTQIVELALLTVSPGEKPAPAALVAVWAFKPEGDSEDVLLSSGTLWGSTCSSRRCASRATTTPSRFPPCATASCGGRARLGTSASSRRRGCPGATPAMCCSPRPPDFPDRSGRINRVRKRRRPNGRSRFLFSRPGGFRPKIASWAPRSPGRGLSHSFRPSAAD
jgi:hypothetical protein